MKRVLSGVKPTGGQMHVGNYFGAIKQFLYLQKEHENYFFIANYHALTTVKDAKALEAQTLEIATEYLACGLDPEKSVLFFQSDVSEVTELAWIFNCLTPMGLLERAHAYKDALANGKEANAGLFDYPVLMAADILIYQPHLVPVGKDQKQHVEIARDIAEKFNGTYGELFILPEPMINEETEVVVGLDGQKMSKSYKNTIDLFEDEKSLIKKVKSIVTDSKGVTDPKDPATDNVFQLFKLFANEQQRIEMEALYREGKIGYGGAKEKLLEVLMEELRPIRERYAALAGSPDHVLEVMQAGGKKARQTAQAVMEKARKMVGIIS